MNKRVFSLLTIICCLTLVLGILVSCNQKTESQDVSFTVLFSVDGEIYAEVTTSDNATISMPANPVKDGYVFDGWYWDDGTWLEPFTVESLANRPLQDQGVLYAKWITEQEALIGTVTLVTNGGSQLSPIRSEVIDTSPVSTREGYMLEGWYTDITLSNKATFPFAVEGDMGLTVGSLTGLSLMVTPSRTVSDCHLRRKSVIHLTAGMHPLIIRDRRSRAYLSGRPETGHIMPNGGPTAIHSISKVTAAQT